MVVFIFFPSPFSDCYYRMSPFWLQKNLCGKAVGGGPFAADEGHLCTDQAGYHEVGAAEPPPHHRSHFGKD